MLQPTATVTPPPALLKTNNNLVNNYTPASNWYLPGTSGCFLFIVICIKLRLDDNIIDLAIVTVQHLQ